MKNNIFYRIRIIAAVIVAVLSLAAVLGLFYPVKIFDLQLAPLIQRVFIDFSAAALILLAVILIITLLFGRLYCSTICPLGLLQEFAGLFKRKPRRHARSFPVKYFIAAVIFGALAGGTAYIMRYGEPYTYFVCAFSLSAAGIIAAAAVIILVILKDRFFCTNICPVGAVLGLISKVSLNKIHILQRDCVSCGLCEKVCPAGSINSKEKTVDNETCLKCLKCLNVCNKNALKYGFVCKKQSKCEFNPKRRKLIVGAAVIVVFAVTAKAGRIIKKALADKFSDVILPPGAVSEQRFLNKCLNCNLCVKACPEKIIKKADSKFCAPSIDYSKNFCKYDCNKCSAACPAGAIKKLSLEEKQKTRIAMIAPPENNFEGFADCVKACPTNALTLNAENRPDFSAVKCIGCGACSVTSKGFIKIYGAVEQKALNK
ncbi:MAG: 4Fe-4S binding protein [Endomicrobium sp.]|jgi:polyferredoxin|nr:4Fe-4S binding protein [Endomicrobium sp.]